ncbi:MAG TPA: PH domain-containing protein [Luteibaculaceae bacterium]|nr:PH domain-containing protein [Luteibaculaceae bacterium]
MSQQREVFKQSGTYLVALWVRSCWGMVRMIWPALLIWFRPSLSRPSWVFPVFIALLLALSAIWAYLRYRRFTYGFEGNHFFVEEGVIKRSSLTIQADSVQSVFTEQSLWMRMLKLHVMKMDTAGSSGQEVVISGIDGRAVEQIRQWHRQWQSPGQQPVATEAAEAEKEPVQAIRLQPIDLLKSGLIQNHFRGIAIAVLFVLSRLDWMERWYPIDLATGLQEAEKTVLPWYVWLALIAAMYALSLTVVLIRSLFRFGRFQVKPSEQGLLFSFGLLDLQTRELKRNQTQVIQLRSTWLARKLGVQKINLRQLGEAEASRGNTWRLPALPNEVVQQIVSTTFPYGEVDLQKPPIDPSFWWRTALFYYLFPLTILACVAIPWMSWRYITAIWIAGALFALLHSYLRWRSFQWFLGRNMVVYRSGWRVRRDQVFAYPSVQEVAWSQSPFQRARQLATLHITLHTHTLIIPYVPADWATRVRDYLLVKTSG